MSERPTELKVGTPVHFDGSPNDASRWLHSVIAYISINDRIYTSDNKKIILALSFMSKGSAATWAEAAYENAAELENFGTWANFQEDFKRTFVTKDVKATAIAKLSSLTQSGCGSLEKFNAEFRLLAHRSSVNSQGALIEWYLRALHPSISTQILRMDKTPETLEGWIAKAEHFNVQNERIKSLRQGRPFFNNLPSNSSRKRDPYAMDVDAVRLSPTQRADYMKKGLCFVCGKNGHRSSDHKGKTSFDKTSTPSTPKVRKTEIPSPVDPISVYAAELKKKNVSQKEILNVLKTCFAEEEEEGTDEEQVPVSRVSLASSF
ncbi:hypothetical protein PAXINDRAFT_93852 [Paxillus involutus ATCC 200175]|uniref:Ty3 transposon capsid-like protein domain-containing protein n=1 Tax=Paxillus involutus ATCC 200175 TaxID=664439 RepID=A0A0C9ST56_PAXIN|nr:hypothetical protein PAXINDRAFT_93852 [Paxillus involutus ATCC 200175]